jgi:hypothetical protein
MSELFQKSAGIMLQVCHTSVRSIPEIYKDYAMNMLEFMMKYARNLPDVCQNWPELC